MGVFNVHTSIVTNIWREGGIDMYPIICIADSFTAYAPLGDILTKMFPKFYPL